MKKLVTLCLVAVFLLQPVQALEGIGAKSAILMDSTGNVMWEQNADVQLEPASVTKIMTMLLVAEAIESGNISFDDMVTVSAHAAAMGGSQIYLKEGEQMSVGDLLKGVAVVSANDGAVALAEFLCGTEAAFVERMNMRAKELGMVGTVFCNTNGLPAEGHLTTARDVGKMSAQLMKYQFVFDFTKIWIDSLRGGAFELVNTNKMIRTYPGMTGLKTGYTSSAGYCLSATAVREELELIAVVMSCDTSKTRNADVAAMLNYGFATYTMVDIGKLVDLDPVMVSIGKSTELSCKLTGNTSVLIERSKSGSLTYQVVMPREITAPVVRGQKIGEVQVSLGDTPLSTIDIVAKDEVLRLSIFEIFARLLKYGMTK